MSTRYVLVGSGIAALSAAEAVRRLDPGGRITMVSTELHDFYSRPGLAYYLDDTLPLDRLTIRTAAEVAELRLERLHGRAVALDPQRHTLELADGRVVSWDRLLLATGAASIPPPFPGADLEGVVTLDGLDGAREMVGRTRSLLFRPRAVVVGGGSTALEMAEGLHERGVETHYLLRGERYWSRVLDPVESRLVEERLEGSGILLHRHTQVERAEGSRGRVDAVRTHTGARIACQILAVAVGVRPRTELARSAGLQVDRGILTDPFLRTSAPDVFAAGDAAQVLDPDTGRADLDTLWHSALLQGRAAGRTMAGDATAYAREVPLNVTRLAGLTTTIVGAVGGDDDPDLLTLTRGQSERWRAVPGSTRLAALQGVDRVRVLVSNGRVTGALVMGDQAPAQPLVRMVRDRVDLGPLAGRLRDEPEQGVRRILERARETAGAGVG